MTADILAMKWPTKPEKPKLWDRVSIFVTAGGGFIVYGCKRNDMDPLHSGASLEEAFTFALGVVRRHGDIRLWGSLIDETHAQNVRAYLKDQ